MPQFEWNRLKSERLKKTRGVSFEEITASKLIGLTDHPTNSNQRILVYEHKNYLWAVPFVVSQDGTMFLKTLYPSRKLMRQYKRKE